MKQIKTPLELYKLLPGTNCGRCHRPSCLAFAAAVVSGEAKLSHCPELDLTAVEFFHAPEQTQLSEKLRQERLTALRNDISRIDLCTAAKNSGGLIRDEKLVIQCLGKDFVIDRAGRVTSDCHTHSALTIPLLLYVLNCAETPLSKEWTPFRELPGGRETGPLFERRCESALRKMADNHPELFENMVDIFCGERIDDHFSADVSVILYPLPKVPVVICRWAAEDDLESKINILFDRTAARHLDIDSIYALAAGLVMMFEKISVHHLE